MAERAEQVSTSGLVDTKQPKRRQYSEALKRQMVAETLAPGASVSIVARRHDVNSNQLFRWRRQLLPEIHPLARDPDDHLVEMSSIARPRTNLPQPPNEEGSTPHSEVHRSLRHRPGRRCAAARRASLHSQLSVCPADLERAP